MKIGKCLLPFDELLKGRAGCQIGKPAFANLTDKGVLRPDIRLDAELNGHEVPITDIVEHGPERRIAVWCEDIGMLFLFGDKPRRCLVIAVTLFVERIGRQNRPVSERQFGVFRGE